MGLKALRRNGGPSRSVGAAADAGRYRLSGRASRIRRDRNPPCLAHGHRGGLILLPILLGYALWEFQTVIGTHFASGEPFPDIIPIDHPIQERDWSVAALLPTADRPPHMADGTMYSRWRRISGWWGWQQLVLTVFISFLAVAGAIYRLSTRIEGLRIVPDLRDPPGRRRFDERCGFEVFERLFGYSMFVVFSVSSRSTS